MAGDPLVVVARDGLVAEDQHVVGEEGALELFDLILRQVFGQVESGDLRAGQRRQRVDADGVVDLRRPGGDALDGIQCVLLHSILLG